LQNITVEVVAAAAVGASNLSARDPEYRRSIVDVFELGRLRIRGSNFRQQFGQVFGVLLV